MESTIPHANPREAAAAAAAAAMEIRDGLNTTEPSSSSSLLPKKRAKPEEMPVSVDIAGAGGVLEATTDGKATAGDDGSKEEEDAGESKKKKRKSKVVFLSREACEFRINVVGRVRPWKPYPEEEMVEFCGGHEDRLRYWRNLNAKLTAFSNHLIKEEEAIFKQYEEKGWAEIELDDEYDLNPKPCLGLFDYD
ncbi:hypothetical protein ACP4OV_012050 [Aristida adscensionis]